MTQITRLKKSSKEVIYEESLHRRSASTWLGTDGTVSLCISMHQYDDDKHGIAYKRLSDFSDVSSEIMTNANLGNDLKKLS